MLPKQHTTSKTNKRSFKYRFICDCQVAFGESIYLLGNVQQLGSWKLQNAIKLTCYQTKNWVCDIEIPIQINLEYKYFVAVDNQDNQLPIFPNSWIGDSSNNNFTLFITHHEEKVLDQQRKSLQLRVMSFNIRAQTQIDKKEFSWEYRKINCLKLIKQRLPSILGIQQGTQNQISFLKKELKDFYNYIGPDDVMDGSIGIFYNRQRFIVVKKGTQWISEFKQPMSVGFGATIPRMFTFAVLQDTFISRKFTHALKNPSSKEITQYPRELFFLSNIYLDYHATQSQRAGLSMLTEVIKSNYCQFKEQIKDVFVLGDFNLSQTNPLIHNFEKSDAKVESIRKNFLRRKMKDLCDLGYTFHAFQHDEHDIENPQKTIDHIFISTKDFEPTRFQVIRNLQEKSKSTIIPIISDHFPIMAVFRYKHQTLGSFRHKEQLHLPVELKEKEQKSKQEGVILKEQEKHQLTEQALKEKKQQQQVGQVKQKKQKYETKDSHKPKQKGEKENVII